MAPVSAQRSWVALVSKAVVLSPKDRHARSKAIPRGADFHVDREDAPRPSYLLWRHRAAPTAPVGLVTQQQEQQISVRILAADRSGLLLVQVVDDPAATPDLFLCDHHAKTKFRLPSVPSFSLRIQAHPDRSICLIGNKDVDGSYLLAQLHPSSSPLRGDRLLCFATTTREWFVKPLERHVSVTDRTLNPCSGAAAIAHDKRFWWLTLAYGIVFCEPLLKCPILRFVPLPADCEKREEDFDRVSVAQRRLVAPSEGLLRYVEVREGDGDAAPPPANPSPSIWMWTLVDPVAAEPWRFEYEAPFAEVWDSDSYAAAGLPYGVVPHVALVDPADHGTVFLFQNTKIFGLDVRARRVVCCEESESLSQDHRRREILLRTSPPIIHAWELLPRRQEDECWQRGKVQRTDQPNLFPHPAPPQEAAVGMDSSSSSEEETAYDRARKSIKDKLDEEADPGAVKKLEREHAYIDWVEKMTQQEEDSPEQ